MSYARFPLVLIATLAAGCGHDPEHGPTSALPTGTEGLDPGARVDALRARFRIGGHASPDGRATSTPVIGADVAASFEATAAGGRRPVVPAEARRAVSRPARVELPGRADGLVQLEDETSHLAISFALQGASDAPLALAGGVALYPGALAGADVIHRPHAEGTEDFVVFEGRPAQEELRYTVDVSRVAGLRLVSNTLEFLAADGTPELRVAPPSVVDARGARHAATLGLSGCAFDVSPAGPWGRAVTRPGADRCVVRVAWGGVSYPLLVDPAWTATGSLATARFSHTATYLVTPPQVLIAGGTTSSIPSDDGALASAELYDPGGAQPGTFAATGAMGAARVYHAAALDADVVYVISGEVYSAGVGVPVPDTEVYSVATGVFGPSQFNLQHPRYGHSASQLMQGQILVTGGQSSATAYVGPGEIFYADGLPQGGPQGPPDNQPIQMRSFHAAATLGTVVLLTGGLNAGATAEVFDMGTYSYEAVGSMASARVHHTATPLGGNTALVAGGDSDGVSSLATAELYQNGTFAAPLAMTAARTSHTATWLDTSTGQVLIAGGYDIATGTTLASTEIFASTGFGSFTAAAPMITARASHTATLLGSGAVLVVGGVANGAPLASAELYYTVPAPPGAACAVGADCTSGFCIDSVCCNTACTGTCMACSAVQKGQGTDGTCGPILAGTDPSNECTATAAATCGQTGSCNGQGACALWVAGTSCAPASCTGATESGASACNGVGNCVSSSTAACHTGYVCQGATCATGCTDDTSCAAGYTCDTASQTCVPGTSSTSSSSASSSSTSTGTTSTSATTSSSSTTSTGGTGGSSATSSTSSSTTSTGGTSSSATTSSSTTTTTAGSTTSSSTTSAGGTGGGTTTSSAATTGAGGAGAGGSGTGGAGDGSGQKSGCGCEVAGDDRAGSSLGFGALFAFGAAVRLRRRRHAA